VATPLALALRTMLDGTEFHASGQHRRGGSPPGSPERRAAAADLERLHASLRAARAALGNAAEASRGARFGSGVGRGGGAAGDGDGDGGDPSGGSVDADLAAQARRAAEAAAAGDGAGVDDAEAYRLAQHRKRFGDSSGGVVGYSVFTGAVDDARRIAEIRRLRRAHDAHARQHDVKSDRIAASLRRMYLAHRAESAAKAREFASARAGGAAAHAGAPPLLERRATMATMAEIMHAPLRASPQHRRPASSTTGSSDGGDFDIDDKDDNDDNDDDDDDDDYDDTESSAPDSPAFKVANRASRGLSSLPPPQRRGLAGSGSSSDLRKTMMTRPA
jgi:hypothetical protein